MPDYQDWYDTLLVCDGLTRLISEPGDVNFVSRSGNDLAQVLTTIVAQVPDPHDLEVSSATSSDLPHFRSAPHGGCGQTKYGLYDTGSTFSLNSFLNIGAAQPKIAGITILFRQMMFLHICNM